jgi:hypothetical protein
MAFRSFAKSKRTDSLIVHISRPGKTTCRARCDLSGPTARLAPRSERAPLEDIEARVFPPSRRDLRTTVADDGGGAHATRTVHT